MPLNPKLIEILIRVALETSKAIIEVLANGKNSGRKNDKQSATKKK